MGQITDEKLRLILEAMQGITYLEWKKLKHVIDRKFDSEASMQGNKIKMASPEVIIDSYKHLF